MRNKNQKKTLKEFGIIVGILFPVIIGWLIPILNNHPFRLWTLFVGLPLLLIAIINPLKLNPIYKNWIKLGNLLGYINSYIILGIIFFTIMLPTSFIMKIVRYDPLRLRKIKIKTYKEYSKNASIDLEKIF